MHDLTLLGDVLILVVLAIPAAALAERIRVPAIVAFLLVGLAIGPSALGLIDRLDEVSALAELGVVLLLFEIGLEVSLTQILRMRSLVVVGGLLQIGLTVGVTTAFGVALGFAARPMVAFGCLLALSSTAVVLKLYADRSELETPHGRIALGILLLQDLAIVPMMVLMPLLSVEGTADIGSGVARIGGSIAAVGALAVGGRVVVPRVLELVADLRNRELFTLTVALFGLGAAYITASVGLSLALGAFLAGLVISESEYGAQAVSDVLPFRALFSGIFFMSVGMLLDLRVLSDNLALVLGLTVGVIVGKALIVTLVSVVGLKRSLAVGIIAGLGLAQVGEFSFVLADVARQSGVLTDDAFQMFLSAAILSMLAAPILISGARPVADLVAKWAGRHPIPSLRMIPADARLVDHTIIVGYGMSGRNLARILRAVHLPYLVLELNGQVVRAARQNREHISFGDATRREVLLEAGIENARAVVFNISSPVDERRGVAVARALNPAAHIVVRTRTVDAIHELEAKGASEVVVEEFEAALELFQRVLRHYRIPVNTITAELDAMRAEHYGLLRGVPKEALRLNELKFLGIYHALELVHVEEGCGAVGQSPDSLDIRKRTGSTVVAAIRDGSALYAFGGDFRFEVGDTVVLVGPAPALKQGAELFQCLPPS